MTFGSWISSTWSSFVSTVFFWRHEENTNLSNDESININEIGTPQLIVVESDQATVQKLESNTKDSTSEINHTENIVVDQPTITENIAVDIVYEQQNTDILNKVISATFHNESHLIDYEYSDGSHVCTDYHLNMVNCADFGL